MDAPSVTAFWNALGAQFARLLAEKAHAELTIRIRDGQVQLVDVNRHILPANLATTK